MNVLDYARVGSNYFNKTHVVPSNTIKAKIYEKNLSVSFASWKTKVEDLIEDLHLIDDEWFGNKEFPRKPQQQRTFRLINNDNKINYESYLEKINRKQILKMKSINRPSQEMKDLCQCLFNAPANIKPGYKVTNNLIGSHIDPLTTSKSEKEKVRKCSDITKKSKTIAEKYKLLFLRYSNQYAGITSDQVAKAQNAPPTPFSTTHC